MSTYTGGLDAWKIGKDVALFALTLFTICLVYWQGKSGKLFNWLLGLSVLYGLIHLLIWTINPDIHTQSALLGIAYNNRLPAFLLLGLGAALLNPSKFVFSLVFKVVLGVSTAVAALGIVQYFLPSDVMAHFGYSLDRGARAAFFIDDNPALPRIMSTLRDPTSLGAYLVLPIAALTVLLLKLKNSGLKYAAGGALTLHLLALFLTFARSAWLAAFLAVAIVLWWQYRQITASLLRRYWPLLAAAVLLFGIAAYASRDAPLVSEYVTHSSEYGPDDIDSNEYHVIFIQDGLNDLVDKPIGYGPGTAGLVSIQNPEGSRLTENYYLQVALELGIAGLAVLVAINVLAYIYVIRRKDMFAIILISSFWGYVVTNMLLHTWSNEAVAAQWWLLAGVALAARPSSGSGAKRGGTAQKKI